MTQTIGIIMWLVALVFGVWFMVSKKKNIPVQQPSLEPLTSKEKLLVFVLCLTNPILLGAIFYYGWKKNLPQQAKTANYLSFAAFAIFLVIYLGRTYLFIEKVGVENIQNIASNLKQAQDLDNQARAIAARPDTEDEADIQAMKDKVVIGYGKAEQWQSDAKFYSFRRIYTLPTTDPEQFLTSKDSYFYESKNTQDNYEVIFNRTNNDIYRIDVNPIRLTAYVNDFADIFTIKVGPKKALEIAMLSPIFQKFKNEHREIVTQVVLNESSARIYGKDYYKYWIVNLFERATDGTTILTKDNSVFAMVDIDTGKFLSPEGISTFLQIQDESK